MQVPKGVGGGVEWDGGGGVAGYGMFMFMVMLMGNKPACEG